MLDLTNVYSQQTDDISKADKEGIWGHLGVIFVISP